MASRSMRAVAGGLAVVCGLAVLLAVMAWRSDVQALIALVGLVGLGVSAALWGLAAVLDGLAVVGAHLAAVSREAADGATRASDGRARPAVRTGGPGRAVR